MFSPIVIYQPMRSLYCRSSFLAKKAKVQKNELRVGVKQKLFNAQQDFSEFDEN